MSASRLVRLVAIVLLCFGLSLSMAQAQSRNIQLCGFTQFVDFVIIDGTVNDISRLVIPSSWIQIVPHTYTLQGAGVFIRDPLLTNPNLFIGGLVLVNPTETFLNNPVCTVSPLITDVSSSPELPLFTGTTVLKCVAGPSGPFQVTLQLQMTTCDEPGFPGGTSAVVSNSLLSRVPPMLTPGELERITTRAEDERLIPAGEAPNEYVQP